MHFYRMLSITGDKRFDRLTWLSIALLLFAYLTHLTYLSIDPREDEVRRALITLEMMISGDYINPTLYGLPYLNKPPLYNWLLVVSFKVFGVNELGLRLPVIVALFFFGYLIYRVTSQYTSRKTAVLASLFFLTNGRILIYDSLLGLIDIFYSSLVYMGFMLGFTLTIRKRWGTMFMVTWLLVAAGYMLKGLPSIVFQGIMFFALAMLHKTVRPFFSVKHIAAVALALIPVSVFYYFYFNENQVSQTAVAGRLVTESTMRTFLQSTPRDFFMHLLTYPFLFVYHFAPWTFYLLLLFRKKIFSTLKQHEFIWYNVLLFGPCFLMYYLSPYVIPRYLFMVLPLLFTVLAWLYLEQTPPQNWRRKIPDYLLLGLMFVIGAGCIVLPFIDATENVGFRLPKALLLAALLSATAIVGFRQPTAYRILFVVAGLVIMRVGFNWFVIEQRGGYQREQNELMSKVMDEAEKRNERLYLETGADLGNADNMAYQYALRNKEILFEASPADSSGLFITDSVTRMLKPHKVLLQWSGPYQPNLYLVQYEK